LILIRIANVVATLDMRSFSLVKPIHIAHVKTQSSQERSHGNSNPRRPGTYTLAHPTACTAAVITTQFGHPLYFIKIY